MSTGRFHGAFTALVTPFKDGKIDEEAYREFIEWQIEQGIDGLVPVSYTHLDVYKRQPPPSPWCSASRRRP